MVDGNGDDEVMELVGIDEADLNEMSNEEVMELIASDGLATRQEDQMRVALAKALGENLDGDGNYYDVFNWDRNPTVDDFMSLALRNPYAYAICFLGVDTAWRDPPNIVDEAEAEGGTRFENDVSDLEDEHRIWHYCHRADKLAGIGTFGILVIQFDDVEGPQGLSEPVGNPSNINGFKPYSRSSIIEVKAGEPGSSRWGEPVKYKIDLSDENSENDVINYGMENNEIWIHHSRVVHIPSDNLLDDEVRGVERLKPVYNNIIDIERALGSAGQLAYRAAAWGINVNIDKDFALEDTDDLHEHLREWQLGYENVLRTHGAKDVQSLGGEEIDPTLITDPNIEALSAYSDIPQSVLKGNETGERATSQDLMEWYAKGMERRREFQNPLIVRETIDRILKYDVIALPQGTGYSVNWEPLAEPDQQQIADVEMTRAETLQKVPKLEMELSSFEQAEYIENGTLPSDLEERVQEVEEVQASMGALDDGVTTE